MVINNISIVDYKIEYLSKEKIHEPEVTIRKIQDGIWLFYISFLERMDVECYSGSSDPDTGEIWEGIMFGIDDKPIVDINFKVGSNNNIIILGENGKRYYHGTLYFKDVYDEIFDRDEVGNCMQINNLGKV